MKRIALMTVVVVASFGSGVVLAAPSGVSRVVLAKGSFGEVAIQAKGPVQITHGITNFEPGGTTGWISWPGPAAATVKAGELAYRNASEQDCARRTLTAGDSFVFSAGSVFENVNTSSETAEVHWVAFLPPGQKLKVEDKPANC